MRTERDSSSRILRRCAAGAVAAHLALAGTLFVSSCGDDKRSYVDNMGNPAVTPTMVTTDVSTLISDSGYTRYHIEAPVWQMFEDLSDPFWKFPKGLDLEQYDNMMRPQARMRCDSAIYFSQRRLWRLDGHVVMVNTARDTFLTPQLYWDQVGCKVYSDSFMHIVRSNHIIEGYGFSSNQNITAYNVHHPTAIIPIDRDRNNSASTSSAHSDSVYMQRDRQNQQNGDHYVAPEPASVRAQRQRDYLENVQSAPN